MIHPLTGAEPAAGPGGAPLPELSVILVMPDHLETIRKTLRHLRAQTVWDRLEVVIVAPPETAIDRQGPELEGFGHVEVVRVGKVRAAAARAAGIRRARAPVVAFGEDHSFPEPDWAEALVAAHRQPWAAVGPVVRNANPGTMTSWANLFLGFGRWIDPSPAGAVPAGEVEEVPGHNSSYKRALLLEYGEEELAALLETENRLQQDLRAKGYRFYLEPAAKTHHVNVSRLSSSLSLRFHEGRDYGASRAESGRWSLLRRLLYIGGGPLIPLIHLRRVLGEIRRSGRQRDLVPWILPDLVLAVAAWAAGEATGYAYGAGDALERLSDIEFYRGRHLRPGDGQIEAC
jgi:glycosyl transferase family 2